MMYFDILVIKERKSKKHRRRVPVRYFRYRGLTSSQLMELIVLLETDTKHKTIIHIEGAS